MWTAIGVLTALSLGILALLSLRRPTWAAAIIILMFSIEQLMQSFFPVLVAHSWVINVSIGATGLAAATARYLRGEDIMRGYFNPVLLLAIGLYLYQVFGCAWSPGASTAISAFQRNFTYLGLYLFIFPALVRDLRDFDSMMRFLLFFGTIVLLLILFNPRAGFVGGRYRVEFETVFAKAGNPLATGRAGGTIAIAAILLRAKSASTFFNLLRVTAFFTGMAMAILSGSRGQSFGAALVIIMMYPMAKKVRDVKQFILMVAGFFVVAGAVFLVFNLFLVEQNSGRFTEGAVESLGARWERVSVMLEEFVNRPERWLFGLGPGGFSVLTGQTYAHNVPTEVLVELGFIGAAIFGSMMLIIGFNWRELHRSVADEPDLRATSAVLMGIFLFNFILSCKQGSIVGAPGPIPYFLLIGRVVCTFVLTRRVAIDEDVEYFPPDKDAHLLDQGDDHPEGYGDFSEYGDFSDYGDSEPAPAV